VFFSKIHHFHEKMNEKQCLQVGPWKQKIMVGLIVRLMGGQGDLVDCINPPYAL
jgi:hypothetical protein